MFDVPQSVTALVVVMRSPRTWGYFGINDISLMVQPGASMLVSGSSSGAGEICLAVKGGALEGRSCLDAIARGSGEEVFSLNSHSARQ